MYDDDLSVIIIILQDRSVWRRYVQNVRTSVQGALCRHLWLRLALLAIPTLLWQQSTAAASVCFNFLVNCHLSANENIYFAAICHETHMQTSTQKNGHKYALVFNVQKIIVINCCMQTALPRTMKYRSIIENNYHPHRSSVQYIFLVKEILTKTNISQP